MSGIRRVVRSLAGPVRRLAAGPLGTVTHVDTDERLAALTFDDGPDARWTVDFAHLLEGHGAKGTFFMIGRRAVAHPDIVQRVAAGGHEIGNHTWDHVPLPLCRRHWRRAQLRWAQEAVEPYGSRLFRPPHGSLSLPDIADIRRMGFTPVTWSVVAKDWEGEEAAEIVRSVSDRLAPGAIVLFHDHLHTAGEKRFRDRSSTLDAVKQVLERYSSFRFVTVSELITRGRAMRSLWIKSAPMEALRSAVLP